MYCSDTRASEHGDDGLWSHGHVDHDSVFWFDSLCDQDVGKVTNFTMKLAVGERPGFARLAFPNDGRFVGPTIGEMLVDAAFTYIKLSSHKPFRVGSFPFERFCPFFLPSEFLCFFGPKDTGFFNRFFVHALVLRHAFDPGFFRKFFGGFYDAVFNQMTFNFFTHEYS